MRQTTRRHTEVIRDDLDALLYSKNYNEKLKWYHTIYRIIPTKVTKVDAGFYITPDMEIAVARLTKLKEKRIPEDAIPEVYKGGVVHENLHVLLFPAIPRAKEVMSVIVGYLSDRGVPINDELLNHVENIISDILNEVVAYVTGIPGIDNVVKTRYYYVENPKEPLEELEAKNPLGALFKVHNMAFADIFHGRTPNLRGNLRSLTVYRIIRRIGKTYDPEEHILLVNSGFSYYVTRPLLNSGLYNAIDKVYEVLRNNTISESQRRSLHRILESYNMRALYTLYFSLVASYYRLALERGEAGATCKPLDTLRGIPIPSPSEAGAIIQRIMAGGLLDPDTLDQLAETLLSKSFIVKGGRFVAKTKGGYTTIPFYRNPRGRIVPVSIAKSRNILEWEVEEEFEYKRFEKIESTGNPPNHITVVIDDSGSTLNPVGVLAPLIGHDTTVLDAERAIALSLMKHILKLNPSATADLTLFSTTVRHYKGSISEIYDMLVGRVGFGFEFQDTNIIEGVKNGIEHHKDSDKNPFLLVTDLLITVEESIELYKLITRLKRSPVLVVVIGSDLGVLDNLNKYKNSAAVSVKSIADIREIEKAIGKITSYIS